MDVSGDAAAIVSMSGKSSYTGAAALVKSCFIVSRFVSAAVLNSVYLMMIIISFVLNQLAEDHIHHFANLC
jgi:hypothetical protein